MESREARMADGMDERIAAVRGFNRFWTRRIGALGEGHLGTPFSLAEARVLYELAQRDGATATDLIHELGLDAGYLSRILRGFVERGQLVRRPSATDARQAHLSLTDAGREAFAVLDAAARRDVGAMLSALPPADQERMTLAMETLESVLGDLGWVVRSHGELYAREYGWDVRFEGLVAEVVAGFVRTFDPARERCWIAERGGENVGSIFLVRATDEVAKLRLLLVHPSARGLGLGGRLVRECIDFARQAGYRRITLWTNDVLTAARRIYAAEGFRVVHTERHDSFGDDMTAETWELDL
jgi:DNA-binding MarR family transcriptional regulator/GNAT superfamily N-acetyltransferase